MTKPAIIMEDWQGRHNASDYQARLAKAKLYEDQSTVCIVPTRGTIPAYVVQNWLGMMTPMNQKFTRIFMIGLEVGDAYSQAVDLVLQHPDLSNWRYILTLEEDNMIPPDGLLKLIEDIKEYDALGALYWTKGEEGQPMCYGRPGQSPINFIPQMPEPDSITPCNGLGMGFTLFKMSSLKLMREKLQGPLFKTVQVYEPGKGSQAYTQDLWHFQRGCELGLKYACSSKVKVGHFDINTGIVW